MPSVATYFGKVLGPSGKMPSPQLGILTSEDEKSMVELKEKISRTVRIKTKEPSIKVVIGKQSMPDEELAENALTVYNAVLSALPRKKENIKSLMIKFTMSKPIKIKEDENAKK
jgi:ribosomal protein L1